MFRPLAGRSVVVTGATRGIGKGIARVFALAGTRVLIVGRDEQAARRTTGELSEVGEVSYVLADVADRAGCTMAAFEEPTPDGFGAQHLPRAEVF